jgi:CheY-like chemotaxis protein
MALQALLVSRDTEVQRTIRRVLDGANIELEICNQPDNARAALGRRKFDAVLVDCDDTEKGPAILQDLRQGKSNKSCIAFALVNGKTTVQQAFQFGANFVLDKPISIERATRSVRAAQGLILRERRRYHRHLLRAAGTILVDASTALPISITNISEGGISIECARQLDQGGAANLKFNLPGAKKTIEIKGEVMWSNPEGQAGIRFQVLPVDVKKELDIWLEKRTTSLGNGAIFINAML